MKNVIQHILLPAYAAYQQQGMKTAAPVALVWISSLAVIAQGMNTLSATSVVLGLFLWMVSQALSLPAVGARRQSMNGQNDSETCDAYCENPLMAVKAALSDARSSVRYARYDLKVRANIFLQQGFSEPLPCCAVAY
ncbi:MAG: hypothetical protein Q9N68_05425 [Gammaproteobacteria bacterium]|nr:hypothetical protein [Gammaproteobacteria bacterium]